MDKKKKILSLESIRGIAAIYVMLGHIVLLYQPYIHFPKYKFLIKTIFGYGHQAVLLFFIVSGFSIAFSSYNLDVSNSQALKEYIFKRMRRIYPLFFISLLFSIFILYLTESNVSVTSILLSFLLLTDIAPGSIAGPIPTNYPIWSLSYEIIYYLLFPLLVLVWNKLGQRFSFILFLVISLISGIIGLLGWPTHITNILQYYWIWIAGAMIANAYLNKILISFNYLNGLLSSFMAFMLTFEKVSIVSDWFWSMFFLTLFFCFFINEGRRRFWIRIINISIGIISVLTCIYLTGYSSIVIHTYLLRIVLGGIGIVSIIFSFIPLTIIRKIISSFLKPFINSGSYSYAIYIIHWPFIVLSVYLFNKLNSNMFTMFLIISSNIIIIISVAWYLECKIQPLFVKILNKIYYKDKQITLEL